MNLKATKQTWIFQSEISSNRLGTVHLMLVTVAYSECHLVDMHHECDQSLDIRTSCRKIQKQKMTEVVMIKRCQ